MTVSASSPSTDGFYFVTYSAEEPTLKVESKHLPDGYGEPHSFKKTSFHTREVAQSGCLDHFHITHTHPRMVIDNIIPTDGVALWLRGQIKRLERDILTFKIFLKIETKPEAISVLIDQISQDKASLTYYKTALLAVQAIVIQDKKKLIEP